MSARAPAGPGRRDHAKPGDEVDGGLLGLRERRSGWQASGEVSQVGKSGDDIVELRCVSAPEITRTLRHLARAAGVKPTSGHFKGSQRLAGRRRRRIVNLKEQIPAISVRKWHVLRRKSVSGAANFH